MELQQQNGYTLQQIEAIKSGFTIKRVIMKDSDTQEIYWDSINHDLKINENIQDITLNSKIITSKAATRIIQFSTVQQLKNLKLVQIAYLGNEIVERFAFRFGFVIPETDNTWESTIVNRPPEEMIPKEIQSGNLIVQIQMFEQDFLVYQTKLRVFYI